MALLKNKAQYIVFIVLLFLGFNYVQSALACIEPEVIYPDLSLLSISQDVGLPLDYIPTNLVDLGKSVEADGSVCLRGEAAQNLIEMFEAAKKDGVSLAVTSAYQNLARQKWEYWYGSRVENSNVGREVVRPGFSEHQLGTAVDLTDSSIKYLSLSPDFNVSRGGTWMRRNAHKYGFAMDLSQSWDKTSLNYEPWHWRYVGPDFARRTLGWKTNLGIFDRGESSPLMVPIGELKPVVLSADGFISVYLDEDTKSTLIAKKENEQLPIASISKLVTAIAIKEYYKEDAEMIIGNDRLSGGGSSGRYRTGDTFRASDLLYSALVESDNDAVMAFANALSEEALVNMMNSIARRSSMDSTVFYTATGLDFWDGGPKYNLSTPNDIVALVDILLKEHPEIMDIISVREFTLYDTNGNKHHVIASTNELLNDTNLGVEIIGGKTGTTPKAKKNLVLVIEPPRGEGVIVNVILGSNDNFGDMRRLISWLLKNYRWTESS